ncbi:MAG: HAMP domain-containing histidine kinase [Deltaproteobacteria bacterium]|nr:HAMP domain-containing histidine kinase [Deltaproteobacteria bacterium]
MDAIEGFCLAICHDLRGPVAAAGSALACLARELATTPAGASQHLDLARRSLAKADELLGSLPNLLELGSLPATQAVPLDLVVARVRDDVDLDLRLSGARLCVRGALPIVRADPHRLRIALRNLVQNACRHPRDGVPLEVRVRAWCRGLGCTLTVSDNGAGFGASPPKSHGGLGLGLAIARQAIETCGGGIVAVSRPGCGASFAITLPLAGPLSEETVDGASACRTGARASRSGSGSTPRASPAASGGRLRGPSPSRDR